MTAKVTASDIMIDTVISLHPSQTLAQAWQVFLENRISGAPVLDHDGNLLGVLSQSDLAREAYASDIGDFSKNSFYWGTPFFSDEEWGVIPERMNSLLVEEVMTPDPICVSAEEDIGSIAAKMRSNHIHRVLVTNGDQVVGIISSLDMLKLLERQ